MIDSYLPYLGAALGAALAAPLSLLYNRFPEPWLQDYDYDPLAANFRPARRMRLRPHTLAVMAALAILFFAAFFFNPLYITEKKIFHVLLMLVPLLPFTLIVVCDYLNRIIPDQLVIAAAVSSLFGFLADGLEGSYWVPAGSPWYMYPVNRILGGIVGAGLLLAVSMIGSWISGQEAMGFGDIKLIFVCGLLSGGYGLIFVVFIAFISGGIYAVPLYIRKRKRIRAEARMIAESSDPVKTRREIEEKNAAVHFAEDPDYLAFGPFLAVGTAIFLILETPIHDMFEVYFLSTVKYLF